MRVKMPVNHSSGLTFTSVAAVVLLFLQPASVAVTAEPWSSAELLPVDRADETPFCSSGITNEPCRVEDMCVRTGVRQVQCWAKVVTHAVTKDKFSWDFISPPMDLNVSIVEATEEGQLHFVEAFLYMEVSDSVDWEPVFIQVDMSLPVSEKVVNLLSDLRHLEMTLSSSVHFAGVNFASDNRSLFLHPEILHSADWRISLFKAECNDPDILSSKWDMLKNKFNLTHLTVQGCHLNGDIFLERQSYLQSLEIASCNLHDLPNDFFEKIPNILSLSLSSNNLTILPRGISHLKRLQQLDLSGNMLLSVHNLFTTLFSLKNLQILQLSKTNITSLFQLEPILNTSSLQLTALHVPRCQLPSLEERDIILLTKQTKLGVLDFSNNSIYNIPISWNNLPLSVQILNLSSNFLTSVKFIFPVEAELEIIDISNNRLYIIGDLLQSGRTNFFNMSHNNIIAINGLNYGRNINHLNLSYNTIQNITETTISSLSSLKSVDLGGNLFNCQICNITILQKWIINEHNVKILALNGTGDLFCSFPKHRNHKVADVKHKECENVEIARNPEWTRVFTISMVISLIFLTIVLLRGYQFETCYLMRLWQNRTDKSRSSSQIYQYDALICYSNADREWVVNELMEKLENAPHFYQFCDHERDFMLGSFISQNVLQSMHLSRHLLFVLSESFFNSQWCIWELEMARHREFEDGGSSPILLRLSPLDQCSLPDGINTLLDSSSTLLGPSEPLFWNKLVNMLGPSLASSSER